VRQAKTSPAASIKGWGYLLSIVFHALVLVIVGNARFTVIVRPEGPRQVVVRIAEPPPPGLAAGGLLPASSMAVQLPASPAGNNGPATGAAANTGSGNGAPGGGGPFAATGAFNLKRNNGGPFRLAPAGPIPEPWVVLPGPSAPADRPGLRPGDFRPAAVLAGASSPVVLLPFDIKEKAVAEWTRLVLARIESNWIIPTSGRVAFSGQVRVSLTIERQGRRQALAVDRSDVPEELALAALHAVESSLPFPPLPDNVAGDALAFAFVFSYNG
jgi:outer membrane biosynthesis protein TonB